MAYPFYLRDRARSLRTQKQLTIDELAERLALPRTTIYYWVRDLPLGRPRRASAGQRKGSLAMQAKYRRLREEAYAEGLASFDELVVQPTFRDFVVLYVAEGSKRNRNCVAICNSDARVVALAAGWLRLLSRNPVVYSLQYHMDQDLDALREFWGAVVDVDASSIRLQRKSNSGQLNGRSWRSEHGVLTVTAGDTLLRARLQAWIDRVRDDWRLDSAARDGA